MKWWGGRSPMALWVRALTYMVIVAGGWLVALPGVLLWLEDRRLAVHIRGMPWELLAVVSFLMATALGLTAGYYLITQGNGTPFPLDPTRKLVTSGPYRWVRNPQGIAMTLAALAEALIVDSHWLWIMVPLTVLYLEVAVGPWEERQLLAQHGARYRIYRQAVRKWVPRLLPLPSIRRPTGRTQR
jgi:protein-S-isoprenylcysteine O-methyltransferase Ste14